MSKLTIALLLVALVGLSSAFDLPNFKKFNNHIKNARTNKQSHDGEDCFSLLIERTVMFASSSMCGDQAAVMSTLGVLGCAAGYNNTELDTFCALPCYEGFVAAVNNVTSYANCSAIFDDTACTSNADCDDDEVCFGGVCESSCTQTSDCAEEACPDQNDQVCNSSGACVDADDDDDDYDIQFSAFLEFVCTKKDDTNYCMPLLEAFEPENLGGNCDDEIDALGCCFGTFGRCLWADADTINSVVNDIAADCPTYDFTEVSNLCTGWDCPAISPSPSPSPGSASALTVTLALLAPILAILRF